MDRLLLIEFLLAWILISSLKLEVSKLLILIVVSLTLHRSYIHLMKICLINGMLLLQAMLMSEQHAVDLFYTQSFMSRDHGNHKGVVIYV